MERSGAAFAPPATMPDRRCADGANGQMQRVSMNKKRISMFCAAAICLAGCRSGAVGRAPVADNAEPQAASAQAPQPAQSAAKSLRLMQFALIFMNARYVDPARIDWKNMTVHAIDAIQNMVPEVVALFDKHIDSSPDRVQLRVGKASRDFSLTGATSLARAYQISEDVYNFVLANLIEPKDESELEYAMINGMFATLDPHTNLLPPYAFEDVMTGNGGFAGCGFVVGLRDDNLVVISPMEGTPSWKAGIKPGDVIVRIDDESTENMPLQDAVDRMRGDEGTTVTLYIKRRGWAEPRPIVITRERIRIKSVTSHAFADDKIGYIKIKSFDQTTAQEVLAHLAQLSSSFGKNSMRGLIIDLRNNSGGLLTQSIEIAEMFLKRGETIVSVEGSAPNSKESTKALRDGAQTGYPVAILLNVGSASASEIVSGALQYYRRATVIGQRSFGKGSVQILKDNPDGSAVKVTSAQYLTPGDISIQGVGIVPDIELAAVYIDADALSLTQSQRERRESNLEQSLRSDKTAARSAAQTIHYIYRENADDEKRAKELGLSKYDLRSAEDYTPDPEIDFARRYLAQAKSDDAGEILMQSADFFRARHDDYNKDLARAFKKLGVDWSDQNGGAAPCEKFEWILEYDGAEAKNGDTIEFPADGAEKPLVMRVKNTCKAGDLTQLSAVLSSNNASFGEREFAFGRIAPGQTREWPMNISIPKSISSRDDIVSIRFMKNAEPFPAADTPANAFRARIRRDARPEFAYSYWIDDIRRGNADGRLSRDESADMYVRVKNTGTVASQKVSVHIANESGNGILLVKGSAAIDGLAPNQSKIVRLSFSVSKDRPQKPPSKRIKRDKPFNPDAAVFRLTIADDAYDAVVEQDIAFDVDATPLESQSPSFALLTIQAQTKVFGAPDADNSPAAAIQPIGAFAAQTDVEVRQRSPKNASNEAFEAICWREDDVSPCAFAPKSALTGQPRPVPVNPENANAEDNSGTAKKSAKNSYSGLKSAENPDKSDNPKLNAMRDRQSDSSADGVKNSENAEDPKIFIGETRLVAPKIAFLDLNHTMNADRARAQIALSDNDGLNHFEAYVWLQDDLKMKAEKLAYDLVSGNEARVFADVPLRIGDNSLVVVARDNLGAESVGIYHINREK